MKTRRHPRTGLRLARTQCVRCARTFPGRVLLADAAYCPECESILDRESKAARFAPGGRAPLVSGAPEAEE